jgi:hypothetical protein
LFSWCCASWSSFWYFCNGNLMFETMAGLDDYSRPFSGFKIFDLSIYPSSTESDVFLSDSNRLVIHTFTWFLKYVLLYCSPNFESCITLKGKWQALRVSVADSCIIHNNGHIFWLVVVDVPLEGRNVANAPANSTFRKYRFNGIVIRSISECTGGILGILCFLHEWINTVKSSSASDHIRQSTATVHSQRDTIREILY